MIPFISQGNIRGFSFLSLLMLIFACKPSRNELDTKLLISLVQKAEADRGRFMGRIMLSAEEDCEDHQFPLIEPCEGNKILTQCDQYDKRIVDRLYFYHCLVQGEYPDKTLLRERLYRWYQEINKAFL